MTVGWQQCYTRFKTFTDILECVSEASVLLFVLVRILIVIVLVVLAVLLVVFWFILFRLFILKILHRMSMFWGLFFFNRTRKTCPECNFRLFPSTKNIQEWPPLGLKLKLNCIVQQEGTFKINDQNARTHERTSVHRSPNVAFVFRPRSSLESGMKTSYC